MLRKPRATKFYPKKPWTSGISISPRNVSAEAAQRTKIGFLRSDKYTFGFSILFLINNINVNSQIDISLIATLLSIGVSFSDNGARKTMKIERKLKK